MKYYLIQTKEDDYGWCLRMTIKAKLKDIKNKVYYYKEIPREHYIILKEYLGDFDEFYNREELEVYFS